MDYKELAARTHLDERRIKAVMQKDFAALSGCNVSMILKVLERELHTDFAGWLEEYEQWSKEHEPLRSQPKIAPKVQAYGSDFDQFKECSSPMKWVFAAILLVLIVAAGVYYEQIWQFGKEFHQPADPVASELNIKAPELVNITKITPEPAIKEQAEPITVEAPSVEIPAVEPEPVVEPSPAEPEQVAEPEQAVEPEPAAKEANDVVLKHPGALSIIPKKTAWVSIKDLASGAERSSAISSPMKLKSPSLVFVGTTAYSLELGSKKLAQVGRFFIYDETGVKFLNKQEFNKLNAKIKGK